MKIIEYFVDPLSSSGNDLQQVSVNLVVDDDGKPYIEVEFSSLSPRIKAEDIGTLIGMLQALQKRAR